MSKPRYPAIGLELTGKKRNLMKISPYILEQYSRIWVKLFFWPFLVQFSVTFTPYIAKNQYRKKKYSKKRNCAATVPIDTFMCLWVIYCIPLFPGSICLFCCRKYVTQSWEYINRSQTHECGNWDWGRAISREEILKCDFLFCFRKYVTQS